jgi:predicted aspartyl protease
MTLARALVLKLFNQYCVLGYGLTLCEVQKLCYFLQEFGEPLRLRFVKHAYGPYADNVRHVLIDFEGRYTRGFVDGSDNTPDNTITLLPRAIEEADAFIEANKSAIRKSLDRLALVEKSIEGYETPFGMELLSKVHWVINHDKIDINRREEIIRAAREWNPRKAKLLKPWYIDKAIKRIASFGNAD